MNVVHRKKGKMTGNMEIYSLYFGRHVECETQVKTGTSVTGLVIMRLEKSPGKRRQHGGSFKVFYKNQNSLML